MEKLQGYNFGNGTMKQAIFFCLNFLKKKFDDKSFFDVEGLSREKKTVNIWNFVFEVEIRFRTRKGQTWEFRFN